MVNSVQNLHKLVTVASRLNIVEKVQQRHAPQRSEIIEHATRCSGQADGPQIPREIKCLKLAETRCLECGIGLDYLGDVSAEQLELVSCTLKVIRISKTANNLGVDTIARCIADPRLLASLLTGKYSEHQSLYRQSETFARQKVEMSRALLSNWVNACCRLMSPLDEALCRYVMNARKIHTDDSATRRTDLEILIFLARSDRLSRATDRPGLPAISGYVQ